ncbi:MAG TPA: peptide deformylase [Bdellovibrionales bacterium]|nr:MAG: hypothetical protein A2Z97_06120 [Bdellovibrionales bacterium GWB1_52_6]OFZ04326.1 MAG: hypothetical protein A2X97_06685 [Bdellovibrionales bacterium GWA1_52_35]OFZ39243.1 MAG: hypothetical protein A2070_01410 [Bdellovibrionales bacterium GWC1_52_8]HAR44031.1 peptide deformylase [Bdellovibrionales bacterium]HCM40822.1 peptide deformylase [Bdellovibrionales bacterium]
MAKLKIYTFPDLVLTKKAAPIVHVDKSKWKLADDMLETMYYAPGVGLAANQVGILERILVIDTEYDVEEIPEGETAPEGAEVVDGGILKNKKPLVVINPKIIHHEGSTLFKEGCLSVPEYNAEVKRFEKVQVEFLDLDGRSRTISAEGLLAVALQHEMDHLDGKLFIDRLNPLKKEMIRKKLRQERAEREAEEAEFGEAALVESEKRKKGL